MVGDEKNGDRARGEDPTWQGEEATVYGGEGDAPREELGPVLARGAEIGRYVILEKLGAGGMGVVYAAYDPELDRKIALKLLLPWRSNKKKQRADSSARLLREAQAMAKLAHPNVITVHDVGRAGDRVFIAMEFVDGATLTEWLADEERSWQEVLDVFVHAGRGLAAAHGAGLIHRDFKPDNVLVGRDGRIRVLDFGLARPTAVDDSLEARRDEPEVKEERSRSAAHSVLSTELTRTGARVGTPAYMSPEQHLGEPLDAASDQFSFCVALYEGLYGRRPFQARSVQAMAFVVSQGKYREPPSDTAVPAWIWRVVKRGLSVSSDERWPSMDQLLTKLGEDPNRARRRVAGWAAGATLVVGGIAGAWFLAGDDAELCQGAQARLVGVWDADQRAAIEGAFADSGLSYAEASAASVTTQLDAYADAWAAMHVEACKATHVHGEQSQEMLDLRMECLADRLDELGAVTKVLAEADAEVVGESVEAVSSLSPVAGCGNRDALRSRMKPPDDAASAAKVEEIRGQLTTVKALEMAGRYTDAESLAGQTSEAAEAVDYVPVQIELNYRLGRLRNLTGDFKQASANLEACYFDAVRIGYESFAESCAREQVEVVGYRGADLALAKMWFRLGEVAIDRGGLDDAERAWLHDNLGMAYFRAAKFDDAATEFRRGLELREKILGSSHAQVASSLNHVGAVYVKQAQYPEARTYFERALKIRTDLQGGDHPNVASILNNLGIVSRNMHAYDDAVAYYERTLELRKRSNGDRHPSIAETLVNIGVSYRAQGEVDKAGDAYERAVEILEEVYGPNHPDVAGALVNVGGIHANKDDKDAAREVWSRAAKIYTGPLADQPEAGGLHVNLGDLEFGEDNFELARGHYDEARRIYLKAYGAEHPRLASVDVRIARWHLQQGDTKRAAEIVGPAIEKLENNESLPGELALGRFVLAKILWKDKKQRDQAVSLAEQALETMDAVPNAERGTLYKNIRTWLAKHR